MNAQRPTFDAAGMTTITVLHKELGRVVTAMSGLSLTQYRTLLKVGESDEAVRIGDIARALGVGASSATQAVDILEARALVRRTGHYLDGRGTVLHATAEGIALLKHVDVALAEDMAHLWQVPQAGDDDVRYRDAIDAIGTSIEGANRAQQSVWVTSGYITSIVEGFKGASSTLRRTEGSTLGECRLLQCVLDHSGRVRIARVAAELLMASSTITHVIDRADARGWVSRETATDDLRAVDLVITEAGREAWARMRAALDEFGARRLWAQLSPEQAELTYEAARRLAAGLAHDNR